jgi:hypothetical protein
LRYVSDEQHARTVDRQALLPLALKSHLPLSLRCETGWIGAPKWEVILSRALREKRKSTRDSSSASHSSDDKQENQRIR